MYSVGHGLSINLHDKVIAKAEENQVFLCFKAIMRLL